MGGVHERARARKLFDLSDFSPESISKLMTYTNKDIHYPHQVDFLESPVESFSHPLLPFGKIKVIEDCPSIRFRNLKRDASKDNQSNPEKTNQKKSSKASQNRSGCMSLSPLQVAVYGTGDEMKSTTLTANANLLRSLPDAGIVGVGLFVHEPRSLVENRQYRKRGVTDDEVG